MARIPLLSRMALLCGVVLLAGMGRVDAADIRVMLSGSYYEAFRELVRRFERESGHRIEMLPIAALEGLRTTISARIHAGEETDVIILGAGQLDQLIREGKAVPGSRVDLARSAIGMAVRSGAAKPDISTVEALKQTLLSAKSVAYSASGSSGMYLVKELFPGLGIVDQVAGKYRPVVGERVGAVVARDEAEIGFHQISELLPVPGIDIVGPLPAGAQRITVFSAGLAVGARDPEAARALIRFLASPVAHEPLRRSGLERMP